MTASTGTKSIVLIELNYHQECLFSLCKLFEKSEYKITVFTTRSIYNEISPLVDDEFFSWVIFEEDASVKNYLVDNTGTIDDHDIVLFNTLDREVDFVGSLNLNPLILVRVHNANTFLNRRDNINMSLDKWFLLKFYVREYILKKRYKRLDEFLNQTDYILLPDDPIAEYAESVNKNHKYSVFPLAFFTEKEENFRERFDEMNSRRIIIPGIIDSNRKDYFTLLDTFKKLASHIDAKFEVYFLGGLENDRQNFIIEMFKQIESETLKISSPDGRVSQKEYKDTIQKAGFMVSPIKISTNFKIFKEEYGKTRMSGSVSDVVRYGKPLLIPKQYPLNDTLAQHINTYGSEEELLRLLKKYLNKDFLVKKHKQLWEGIRSYDVKNSLNTINTFTANG